jgi:3',5'-cyclic AMP phosphodiesterase CpdA
MTDLALVADIHMRDAEADRISAELRAVMDRWEEYNPDHAFVLGDLIEDGDSASGDLANLERVRDIVEAAPCPVTYLLGNHDVEQLTRPEVGDALDQPQFHGVVELDDTAIIYLDSTLETPPGARGSLGATQRTWLETELPKHDTPLVLCHHPLGNFDLSGNVWFEDYPERAFAFDRQEALDVLEDGGPVRGTVSGHIHQPGFVDFRGMAHVSLNAFSKETPDTPLTGTYAEVQIDDGVTIDVKVGNEIRMSYTLP